MKNENRHISNVDYWQADILSAYDYSPFGVMLTGRTFEKEETVEVCHNETTLTTTPVLEEGFGSWSEWTPYMSMTPITVSTVTYLSDEMQIKGSRKANIGAHKTFTTGIGLHSVSFDITGNTCQTQILFPPTSSPKPINVYIKDSVSNTIIASASYTTAGSYSISFTPSSAGITYKIEFYMTSASALCYFSVDNVLITYQSEETTQVCENVSRSGSYRYGFNNMEKDDQVKGRGNSYDFGARMQDPRLGGRFFSIDPLISVYPDCSPYVFAGNNPIAFIDDNGEGPRYPEIADLFEEQLKKHRKYVSYTRVTTSTGVEFKLKIKVLGKEVYTTYKVNSKTDDYYAHSDLTAWGASFYQAAIATSNSWKQRVYYKVRESEEWMKESPWNALIATATFIGTVATGGELIALSKTPIANWGPQGFGTLFTGILAADDFSEYITGENKTGRVTGNR